MFYLAMYRGHGSTAKEKCVDNIIRFFTRGTYSHCEIVKVNPKELEKPVFKAQAWTASPRDKGVRTAVLKFDQSKWDFIPLPTDNSFEPRLQQYFHDTKGLPYDMIGAIGVVLGTPQSPSKFFCSEWCYNVIFNSKDGWRFSPHELGLILKDLHNANCNDHRQ